MVLLGRKSDDINGCLPCPLYPMFRFKFEGPLAVSSTYVKHEIELTIG